MRYFSKLNLLFHTILHLKPGQVFYRGKLYLQNRLYPQPKLVKKHPELERQPLILKPTILKRSLNHRNVFTFLNKEKDFGDEIDWNFKDFGLLWGYNLNYFEYLNHENTNPREGKRLLNDFIKNLSSISIGFDSYPLSLRIMNWVHFLTRNDIQDSTIDNILFEQVRLLKSKPEYHLLGNHLLENGFALLAGAFYFHEITIYDRAKKILFSELNEQILEDGAHFELSPMYHQIILERLLDGINLLQNNQRFKEQDALLKLMTEKANSMLAWLSIITFEDGTTPLFNDSAPGIAPTTKQINEYASRLGLPKSGTPTCYLQESGYRKFSEARYECVIDIGEIGPSYQPGHAHADTFNFVLHTNSRPFIIDAGISTYEVGKTRLKERGTAAHNTVTVGDKNSSEVWSSFRVARRASVEIIEENRNLVIAEHNGYRRMGTTHRREWSFSDNQIVISDQLIGKKRGGKAHLILSPSVIPVKKGNTIQTTHGNIHFEQAGNVRLSQSQIPNGYNQYQNNYVIEIDFKEYLKTTITI